MSPKLARHLGPVTTTTHDYKYQQIEKILKKMMIYAKGVGKI